MFECEVLFNGEPVAQGQSLCVSPGLPHTLSLSVASAERGTPGFRGIARKTLPNGDTDQEERDLSAGDTVDFALGPMTASPRYVYEAGAVYRVGYRIELTVKDQVSGDIRLHAQWSQALSSDAVSWRVYPGKVAPPVLAGAETFVAGAPRRTPYNPKRAVEAALALRLDESVLGDRDNVRALFRINEGALADRLPCRLRVADPTGRTVASDSVTVCQTVEWQSLPIETKGWPAGNYRIALHPEIGGRVWPEGPEVEYRRREVDGESVPVSPLAPWTLRRDTGREDVLIRDFARALDEWGVELPRGWTAEPTGDGTALSAIPGENGAPVDLRSPVQGPCAVFAAAHGCGCFLEAGDGLVRPLAGPDAANEDNGALHVGGPREIFVTVAETPEVSIRVFGFGGEAAAGLASLRLVPVTAESARAFRKTTGESPTPLRGVNDWGCFFAPGRPMPPRMEPDQFDTIVAGQVELGLRTLDWSVGRSCVNYKTRLPGVPRVARGPSDADPLDEALRCADQSGARLWGWFAMMYYGKSKSEQRNRMFRNHPEFRRWRKNARGPDEGQQGGQLLSFYFPEIRRDKAGILLEVAERGAAGLLVGTGRLAPVMDYHPKMVAEFKRRTGVDPLRIDAARKEEYTRWIAWRADFFTELLRDVRAGLAPIEEEQSRSIPLAVRIPSAGLYYNLAQGLDVERWLREGLVDRVQLDPVEDRGGPECNPHDIGPYVELGRRFGVSVFGGLGSTWMRAPEALPAALRRALGLLDAGVDGIELYESELLGRCSDYRWVAPLFGNAERLRKFLGESNIEACYPLSARTCMYGYDNHSRWFTDAPAWVWDIYGFGENSL